MIEKEIDIVIDIIDGTGMEIEKVMKQSDELELKLENEIELDMQLEQDLDRDKQRDSVEK